MWSIISAVAIVIAQGQPNPPSKWCFERGQGALLCEETEGACKQLLDLNTEIAISPCKPVELPEKKALPMEPSKPERPERTKN